FFQAEDGIRDLYVTGVQTCALPISLQGFRRVGRGTPLPVERVTQGNLLAALLGDPYLAARGDRGRHVEHEGRELSARGARGEREDRKSVVWERGWISVGAGSVRK